MTGYQSGDPRTWRPPVNPKLTWRARRLWRRLWAIEVVREDGSSVTVAWRLSEAAANRVVARRQG